MNSVNYYFTKDGLSLQKLYTDHSKLVFYYGWSNTYWNMNTCKRQVHDPLNGLQ
jgi:hypothetical protein